MQRCLSWWEIEQIADGQECGDDARAHLAECGYCARRLEQARRMRQAAAALPSHLPTFGPDAVKAAVASAPPVRLLSCRAVRKMLAAYADGLLDEHRRAAIEVHLSCCDECQKAWRAMVDLRSALSAVPVHQPPDGLRDRVHAAVAAEAARQRPMVVALWRPAWALAAAAVFVVMAFVALWVVGLHKPALGPVTVGPPQVAVAPPGGQIAHRPQLPEISATSPGSPAARPTAPAEVTRPRIIHARSRVVRRPLRRRRIARRPAAAVPTTAGRPVGPSAAGERALCQPSTAVEVETGRVGEAPAVPPPAVAAIQPEITGQPTPKPEVTVPLAEGSPGAKPKSAVPPSTRAVAAAPVQPGAVSGERVPGESAVAVTPQDDNRGSSTAVASAPEKVKGPEPGEAGKAPAPTAVAKAGGQETGRGEVVAEQPEGMSTGHKEVRVAEAPQQPSVRWLPVRTARKTTVVVPRVNRDEQLRALEQRLNERIRADAEAAGTGWIEIK